MKTTLFLLALLSAGACASNFYGYKAPLPGVSINDADNLLGFKVTVTTGGALQAFGADFRAASGDGSMGLYAADGAGGDPGTLVAQTGSFAIAAAGVLERPLMAPVTLAAGDYWIMAVFSGDAYPGYDYSGIATEVIKYRTLPFSGMLPTTFGTTTAYTGAKINYYIKVAGSIHAVLFARDSKVPTAGDDGSGVTPGLPGPGLSVAVKTTLPASSSSGSPMSCLITLPLSRPVRGSTGVTRAFNGNYQLVFKAVTSDRTQIIARIADSRHRK